MPKKDIVERLREGAYSDGIDDATMKEAADVIERLRYCRWWLVAYVLVFGVLVGMVVLGR